MNAPILELVSAGPLERKSRLNHPRLRWDRCALHLLPDSDGGDGSRGTSIPTGTFAAIQLSWSHTPVRAPSPLGKWLLKPPELGFFVHAVLRGRGGAAIRLRAPVDAREILRGLPMLASPHDVECDLDTLVDAVNIALLEDGHLASWQPDATLPAPPPLTARPSSRLTRALLLLAGRQQTTWLVLAACSVLFIGMGAQSQLAASAHWLGAEAVSTTSATVQSVDRVGSVSGSALFAVSYRYQSADGQWRDDISYTTSGRLPKVFQNGESRCWNDADRQWSTCAAHYRADRPRVSRLAGHGYRDAPMPTLYGGVFILLMICLGVGFRGMHTAALRRWTLHYGSLHRNRNGLSEFVWTAPGEETTDVVVRGRRGGWEVSDAIGAVEVNRYDGTLRTIGRVRWMVLPLLAWTVAGYALAAFLP